ncbi:hypothetical protein DFJ73DRAFT_762527 [Zopfochytrium polystomum]|nr:hypothetical protein DFJ73DRAFT_762527 [Zopfochytrium polystomum]
MHRAAFTSRRRAAAAAALIACSLHPPPLVAAALTKMPTAVAPTCVTSNEMGFDILFPDNRLVPNMDVTKCCPSSPYVGLMAPAGSSTKCYCVANVGELEEETNPGDCGDCPFPLSGYLCGIQNWTMALTVNVAAGSLPTTTPVAVLKRYLYFLFVSIFNGQQNNRSGSASAATFDSQTITTTTTIKGSHGVVSISPPAQTSATATPADNAAAGATASSGPNTTLVIGVASAGVALGIAVVVVVLFVWVGPKRRSARVEGEKRSLAPGAGSGVGGDMYQVGAPWPGAPPAGAGLPMGPPDMRMGPPMPGEEWRNDPEANPESLPLRLSTTMQRESSEFSSSRLLRAGTARSFGQANYDDFDGMQEPVAEHL